MEEREQRNMLKQDRARLNQLVIEEFRTHDGKVGGLWEGMPLLLLTTTGAKSGQKRITPLNYLLESERLFVFAANGGAPTNPDWYHNLLQNPTVRVEVSTEHFQATAVVVEGEERGQILAKHGQQLGKHMKSGSQPTKPTRTIPVVELVRHKS